MNAQDCYTVQHLDRVIVVYTEDGVGTALSVGQAALHLDEDEGGARGVLSMHQYMTAIHRALLDAGLSPQGSAQDADLIRELARRSTP